MSLTRCLSDKNCPHLEPFKEESEPVRRKYNKYSGIHIAKDVLKKFLNSRLFMFAFTAGAPRVGGGVGKLN